MCVAGVVNMCNSLSTLSYVIALLNIITAVRGLRRLKALKFNVCLMFIVERKKELFGDNAASTVSKKLGKQEEQLKNNSRDLNTVKMKSMVAIGLTFTALMGMFNTM